MADKARHKREAAREACAWVSLAIFLVTTLSLGSISIARALAAYLGFDMQRRLIGWEPLWVIAIALPIIVVLAYLAVIAWLLFATLLFARAEISKIVFYGPTTRLERWLVDVLFPP